MKDLRLAAAASALLLASLGSACGSSSTPTAPTPATSTTVATVGEVFTGTLDPLGSSFYSYTVTLTGPLAVTLSSLMLGPLGPAVATPVGIGVGAPAETDCSITSPITVTPALTAHISNASTSPGTYCVRIFDTGNLKSTLIFAIRIAHS